MQPIATVFSLLIAAAGWYYMFYSRAAENLGAIEHHAVNLRRQRLRQINGFLMLLMAVGFFAGFHSVDPSRSAAAFLLVWLAVFLLFLMIVVLTMMDLRLTWRLMHRRQD